MLPRWPLSLCIRLEELHAIYLSLKLNYLCDIGLILSSVISVVSAISVISIEPDFRVVWILI